MKMLIVDDNNFSLQYTKNALLENKIDVTPVLCNSGAKALEMLKSTIIDIILLDIVMPDISGIDVLRFIRSHEEYQNMQVIMITSVTDRHTLKDCFDLGANDFINKPIEEIEFTARINAAIRARESSEKLESALGLTLKQNRKLNEVTIKLKEAQSYLIQNEKLAAIGELAAGVAHEINNPMGFISSNFETLSSYIEKFKLLFEKYDDFLCGFNGSSDFFELMQEKEAINKYKEKSKFNFILEDLQGLIKDTGDGIDRVTKIVQSLRRFGRMGQEEEATYYDICEIIDESMMIANNEIKYTTDIVKNYEEVKPVYCNRVQIGQVIINILINGVHAIKTMKREERGLITVKVYMENDFCIIDIADNGPGVKKEIIGKIFDPFFTTKDVGEGTGLGLSICYDIIVNKHKGALEVASEEGNGAEFIIKLPLVERDQVVQWTNI